MPLPDSLKLRFCEVCRDIASDPQRYDERFELECDAFAELAQIVTLRRFHAGQNSFDVMRRMPLGWLLKTHPFDLPGYLWELCFRMRGLGPVVEPHINYWRTNQVFLSKREHERSIWRIAQFVEERPSIKGLITSSWLYAVENNKESPHLSWLREFYQNENAKILDAGDALSDAGFLIGSERRRQLFASGLFRPRETIVLWSRADMLAWARRHPEFANGGPTPPTPRSAASASAIPRAHRWRSGRWTLIDCRRLLYYRPRRYIALTLALPAALGACVAAVFSSMAAPPVFIALFAVLWLVQYLFLQ